MTKKYTEEVVKSLNFRTAMLEASRCLLCLDAPCSKSCPAGTDPGKFIRSVRFKNYKGAAETIRENNSLGSICARVCPTERYCQLACSRTGIDKPIEIGRIQRFITDFEASIDMEIYSKVKPNGKKVAIVGSGPSALQASCSLLRLGYHVEIFEKNKKLGGYLTYGIPEYRLPSSVVDYEIDRIVKLGLITHTEVCIGKDKSLAELKKEFDAVIIAVGVSNGKELPLFKNNKYVETAISFLSRAKEAKGKIEVEDNYLVIGGGDVAMDVNTTLKLLGCKNVTDVVYEQFSEFKASESELKLAQEEGVTIIDGYVPVAVKDNLVTFSHRVLEADLRVKADRIILAVGQEIDATNLGLKIINNEVDSTNYETDDKQVFVTGDIVKDDKTVVYAVKKGKEVAEKVDASLRGGK